MLEIGVFLSYCSIEAKCFFLCSRDVKQVRGLQATHVLHCAPEESVL